MELKGKAIVVTGASDGIGKEIALRLARESTKLALIGRDNSRLNEVSKKAKDLGAEVKTYACDLRETDKMEKTVQTIISDFNGIDILINNAGIWHKVGPVESLNPEIIDEVIQTNLLALIHITKLFIPTLNSRKEAAIINISSKSGTVAQEGQSVYTASKYGVRGFTEVLRADLKSTKIRVAGVYQGGINTKMFEKAGDDFPTQNFTPPEALADVIAFMLSRPEKTWLYDVRVQY